MRINNIEVTPIAAESMGVRSLCTLVKTPDVTVVFDPSAALAMRYNLEPHPNEYKTLQATLEKIRAAAEIADILSISHYHYDHLRPGFTNYRYNLSKQGERKDLFSDKVVLAKDNREHINASQRRRGYYFEKDISSVVKDIQWADNRQFCFQDTTLTYSPPLPHGPSNGALGYVLTTTIEHSGTRIVFAPDIQGPMAKDTLVYLLSQEPELAIIGGPPIYLNSVLPEDIQSALYCLSNLASAVPILVVDHHIIRALEWRIWMNPVVNIGEQMKHEIHTMASLAKKELRCFESERVKLYEECPPSEEFITWTQASEEYKVQNMPPL